MDTSASSTISLQSQMTQYSNVLQMKSLFVERNLNPNPCIRIQAIILGSLLLAFEVLFLTMYGLFMKYPVTTQNDQYGVSMLFFLLLLLLVGFGLLLTYIRTASWSGLGYTLFILAITIQHYMLIQAFWTKAQIQPSTQNFIQKNAEQMGLTPYNSAYGASFSNAIECAIAVFVSYSAIHGRVGPLQVFLHTLITVGGFEINRQLLVRIGCLDNGGSMGIFLFGSMSGIVVSWILGVQRMHLTNNHNKYRSQRMNMNYALIGTLFIWVLLPVLNSVNAITTISATNKTLSSPYVSAAAINTWFALSAGTWATFCTSILLHRKVSVHDLVFGGFSGGIAFGASSNLVGNPVAPIVVGVLAGVISTFLLTYLQKHMNRGGVLDSNGVVSTFMFSGFQGGLWAAVFMTFSGLQQYYTSGYVMPYQNNLSYYQASLEVAGTFISAGVGTVTGFVSTALLRPINRFDVEDFFDDGANWTIEEDGLYTYFDQTEQVDSSMRGSEGSQENSRESQPA